MTTTRGRGCHTTHTIRISGDFGADPFNGAAQTMPRVGCLAPDGVASQAMKGRSITIVGTWLCQRPPSRPGAGSSHEMERMHHLADTSLSEEPALRCLPGCHGACQPRLKYRTSTGYRVDGMMGSDRLQLAALRDRDLATPVAAAGAAARSSTAHVSVGVCVHQRAALGCAPRCHGLHGRGKSRCVAVDVALLDGAGVATEGALPTPLA